MPNSSKSSFLSSLCRNHLAQKCALVALAVSSLGAGFNNFAPDGYEEPQPDNGKWQDASVQLPAPPQDADMMPFYVGPTATQQFFVDIKSVSIAGDNVVRYTLISKSSSGAVNVSYEGTRCETAQYKQYAYGGKEGAWTLARQANWQPITELVANRQHAALLKDYFCDSGTVAGPVDKIVKRLKYQRPMAPAREYSGSSDSL